MATITEEARLNLRLPPDKKREIERAAAIRGLSLTDFVVATMSEKSREVIQEYTTWVLSNEAFDAMLDAIEHPKPPTEALRRAMARYREDPI